MNSGGRFDNRRNSNSGQRNQGRGKRGRGKGRSQFYGGRGSHGNPMPLLLSSHCRLRSVVDCLKVQVMVRALLMPRPLAPSILQFLAPDLLPSRLLVHAAWLRLTHPIVGASSEIVCSHGVYKYVPPRPTA